MNIINLDTIDLSKCSFINSKLDIDVFKLFSKIKIQCLKLNPSSSDEILSHLFHSIKLFNGYKIDSVQLLDTVKSIFASNSPHLYYDFIHIMQRIQKETNNLENKSKAIHNFNSSKLESRKDLNFSNLNDCGPSYRLLPSDYKHKQSSGRLNNEICKECLNDNYICFPSMTSEDTSVVSSKKNVHEEQIHRLEDERYEVDMFQEINKYALKHLTDINKKMELMSKEEKLKFQLDDYVGGSSAILMRKAIYRIYGDATDNMIEGLKVRPKMAIPLVISRMQEKAKEWSQIHGKFKMVWEDRANKHYWQSLDYQGDWVKRDAIFLKRSTFYSQIDSLSKGFPTIHNDFFNNDFIRILSRTINSVSYDYMIHTQFFPKGIYGNLCENSFNNGGQPSTQFTLLFPTDGELFFSNIGISIKDIIENANSLILNQINLQSNLSKEDKQFLIDYIYQIIGWFFNIAGAQIPPVIIGSTREQKDRKSDRYITSPTDRRLKYKRPVTEETNEQNHEKGTRISHGALPKTAKFNDEEVVSSKPLRYSFMFGNSYIYTFIRLYHVLIDRLSVLKIHGAKMGQEDIDFEEMSGNDDVSNDENDRYSKVLRLLLDSTESSSETTINIDNKIRILFTTKAFLWFTIPRIVQQIVKSSQQIICAGLESSKDLLDMYCAYSNRIPSGTSGLMTNRELYLPMEKTYANEAVEFCINQGLVCFLLIFIKQEGRLLIQLIDTDQMKLANDVHSECGSPVSSETLKLHHEDTNDYKQTSYEKFVKYPTLSRKSHLSKNIKSCPLFLMKNVKRGIRKLTSCLLNYWKHESFKRGYPSMEEIAFMKVRNSLSFKSSKSNSILDSLKTPLQELYRSAFIGNGDIFNSPFEKNCNVIEKNGFIFKKNGLFCQSKIVSKTKKKRSFDELIISINNSRI